MSKTINVSDKQGKLVEEKVQSGEYASESEVIQTGLRLLDERDRQAKKLRAEIQKGIESGDPIPAEEVFTGLRERAHMMRHSKKS
jgi:antitoxin ParD1/3/4